MTAAVTDCPECADAARRGDRFCEGCGTNLGLRRASTLDAVAPPDGPCAGCGEPVDRSGAEHCSGCGLLRPDGTEHVELDLGSLAGVSDRGHSHPRNEDAFAVGRHADGTVTAVVVCDGISIGHRPELASRHAADAALDVLLSVDAGLPGPQRARRAFEAAARAVNRLRAPRGEEPSSCTLVCALVEDDGDGPAEITVGWVGDSRAYWLAEPGTPEPARRLTIDHSWAEEQVASGALDADTAGRHRLAHAITRWVGPDIDAELDVVTLRPAGPGALLLCSDGLWNYRPDAADLAGSVRAHDPLTAARTLTGVALDAGGRDNVTVVVVPVGAGPGATERSRE